jgi:hypothetical protein
MNSNMPPPQVGQIVHVRQRQYLVEEVESPLARADATLVRLACLDDDARGQELQVVWESEVDARPLSGAGWDSLAARGFDAPRLFSAYLHTLRWNCVTATNPRRLKEDLREEPSIGAGFPRRIVQQIDLDGLPEDAPELVLSQLLDQYRRLRETRMHGESRRKQTIAALLITGLQQRLLSSVEAFARTLRLHRRTVERKRRERVASEVEPAALDLLVGGLDAYDDRTTIQRELYDAEEDAQVEAATLAEESGGADPEEDRLLEEMTEIAEAARDEDDARVRCLIAWIRKSLCPGSPPKWNDTRVLIFTEYEDTQRYLSRRLEAALEGTDRADQRIAVYSGPTPADQREEIKRAFNGDPAKYPLRILIATDAAREGINLQTQCWNLFHFDVPWNPGRMEQRNGRIDRKLQTHDEVYCHYFVYPQRAEDRVLKVLVRKTETIKRELGSLSQVVEEKLAVVLGNGIRHADADRLAETISNTHLEAEARAAVEEELEAARVRREALKK